MSVNNETPCNELKCNFCDKVYVREKAYKKHMETKHEGEVRQETVDVHNVVNMADISLDMEQFPGELALADEAEIMVMFENCDDCSNKDGEVKRLIKKHKALDNSKRFLQKKCKDLKNELLNSRNLLEKITKENVVLKQQLNTEVASTVNNVDEDQPTVKCNYCNFSSRTASILMKHTNSEHFKCKECEEVYKTEQQLKLHIENIHITTPKPKCADCNITFPNSIGFDVHMQKKHQKRFQCHICKDTFSIKNQLKNHMTRKHMPNVQTQYENTGIF